MKLNPFIRFRIDCPVSAEQARNRLLKVAKVQRLLVPDCGLFYGDGSPRYVGKVKHDRFRLRTRPRLSFRSLFLHLNRQIVIHGRIENRGPRSLIKIFIRPMTPVLLGVTFVSVGLVYIVTRIFDAGANLSDWIFLAFFAVWIYSSLYICTSVAVSERDFLESLFTRPPAEARQQRSGEPNAVGSGYR